jgi:hypothetical protein
MDTNSKIAFESKLNNLFNELWLVRMLHDFHYNFPFDESNIVPGMMFKLYHTNADGSETNISQYLAENDELKIHCANFLKWVNEPHIVTGVKHYIAWIPSTEISFQPIRSGDNTWKITKKRRNYYFNFSGLNSVYKYYIEIHLRSIE